MRNIFIESVSLSSALRGLLCMAVARRGRAEMGEAGAGQMQMRRIGMA